MKSENRSFRIVVAMWLVAAGLILALSPASMASHDADQAAGLQSSTTSTNSPVYVFNSSPLKILEFKETNTVFNLCVTTPFVILHITADDAPSIDVQRATSNGMTGWSVRSEKDIYHRFVADVKYATNEIHTAIQHIKDMREDGTLNSIIQELIADGSICKIMDHQWRAGRPGEWINEATGIGSAFADNHPGVSYRTCRICGTCQTKRECWDVMPISGSYLFKGKGITNVALPAVELPLGRFTLEATPAVTLPAGTNSGLPHMDGLFSPSR